MDKIPSESNEKTRKSKRGGKRPNSGRKPDLNLAEVKRIKALISQHGIEVDPKDTEKRIRILRLLDILYEQGSTKKDVRAIKEYFDRQLGKSKETVELEGDLPFTLTIIQKK